MYLHFFITSYKKTISTGYNTNEQKYNMPRFNLTLSKQNN